MKPLVSIIVPIFNKDKYLEKCINSIIMQSYRNIEIILIDDGSTDNSLLICNEFGKKDDRIHIISKKNEGVSAARNDGIRYSSGQYICFIDADDYIDVDYIENLIDDKYDFCVCGYTVINTINNSKKVEDCNNCLLDDSNELIRSCMDTSRVNLMVVPYAKMFNRDIIINNDIMFRPSITFGEDSCFVFDYLKNVNSVKFISYYGYNNIVLDGTLSRKYINNFKSQISAFSDVILEMKDYCDIKIIDYWIFRNYKLLLFNERKTDKLNFYQTLNYINENIYSFTDICLFSLKDKVLYFLLKYRLFFAIYLIYKFR